MAMIVDDGHLGRMIVIQFLRGSSLKQEVFVHEFFHYSVLFKFRCSVLDTHNFLQI